MLPGKLSKMLMKQIRTIVEFWSPLVAQTQVTFDVYCYVLLLFIYCKVCFLCQRYWNFCYYFLFLKYFQLIYTILLF
jgi:hypothetical protein